MNGLTLAARNLASQYGKRRVYDDVTFDMRAGQCLGVVGPNGAGKTTLLRTLVGALTPCGGEIRINGLLPRDALRRTELAYFAGEATLPGFVRASRWGRLGTGAGVTQDRRPMRALSRGSRQLLGLRTVLGRQPLQLIVLDEPWEGLDPDGARWLTTTLELKRDRGAAVILASHRLQDLAGLCDGYLLLVANRSVLVNAHQIAPFGTVTAALLGEALERARRGLPVADDDQGLDDAFDRVEPPLSAQASVEQAPGTGESRLAIRDRTGIDGDNGSDLMLQAPRVHT